MAAVLDLQYEYLVEHPRPTCVLRMLLDTPPPAAATTPTGTGQRVNLARQVSRSPSYYYCDFFFYIFNPV